jgi:energy-coupling factor transporter ATP-binding protein EcfA2
MVTIQPGECTVIMGMKGTGKTTLQREIARTFRQDLDVPTVVWDPIGQYPSPVSYRPRCFDDRDELDQLARRIWQHAPARLEIEEAEQVLPQGPDLPSTFKAYALMGRNYGLSWGVNTRRPQAVSKHILNLADHLFIFKLELRDRGYLHKFLGRPPMVPLAEPGTAYDLPDEIDINEGVVPWDDLKHMPKDPREGGGFYLHYNEGKMLLHRPLDLD